jgi:hypothetical protein
MYAREWYKELNSHEQKKCETIAKFRLRVLIGKEADDYFQRSFLYWWESAREIPYFRPGLVVCRAYLMYLDDMAHARLDYVGDLGCGAEPDRLIPIAAFVDRAVNIEKDANNKALIAAMQDVLSDKQAQFLADILYDAAYNNGGDGVDNITLADDLGVDVTVVRKILDNMKKRLKRHGFAKGMIYL